MADAAALRRLSVWLRAARAMPPGQVVTRAVRRLGIEARWLRRLDLLSGPEPHRPLRGIEILTTALGRAGCDAPAFWTGVAGARVLEIGCGQHGGLGPACVALGAARYSGVDPGLDVALFDDAAVRERLSGPALTATAGHFETTLSPAALLERQAATCRHFACALERCESTSALDLFVSISCLEHVGDLGAAIAVMRRRAAPGARHLHLVNFANHTDTARPFDGLYEAPLPGYLQAWGGHINGLRAPDVARLFGEHDIEVAVLPLDVRHDALPARIDPWWSERYDRDTLALRTALILTPSLCAGAPAARAGAHSGDPSA